jgi:hypothetical protein
MYSPTTGVAAGAAATGTALAFTGLNAAFDLCAAFAVLAAGLALLRIAPRFSRSH